MNLEMVRWGAVLGGRALAALLALAALAAGAPGLGGLAAQEEEDERRRSNVRVSVSGGGGYLGVGIEEVDAERASELGMERAHGAYVTTVAEDGPAEGAGLEDGDVIVAWNGDRVEGVAHLQRLARETPAGRAVDITVLRAGTQREFAVELGERGGAFALGSALADRLSFTVPSVELRGDRRMRIAPRAEAVVRAREALRESQAAAEEARSLAVRAALVGGGSRLGASIQRLGDQLAEYFGVEGGALVTSVRAESPAREAGLRAGDVIVGIGEDEVDGPGDVTRAVARHEGGELSLRVMRDGSEQTLTAVLEERERPLMFRWRRGGAGDDGEEAELEWLAFDAEAWEEAARDWEEWVAQWEASARDWEAWGEAWEAWAADWEEWGAQWESAWDGVEWEIDVDALDAPQIDVPQTPDVPPLPDPPVTPARR